MSHSAGTVKCSFLFVMSNTIQVLQLNVRKQEAVQQSLMNDSQLKDFAILAISEPHIRMIDNTVVMTLLGHAN